MFVAVRTQPAKDFLKRFINIVLLIFKLNFKKLFYNVNVMFKKGLDNECTP